MHRKNALYAQSGGVTATLNASAYGVFRAALENPRIDKVFAACNGARGLLEESLVDVGAESESELSLVPYTPGAILGSCRRRIRTEADFQRLFEVLDAHDIGYFFYNGGNDSMETAHVIAQRAEEIGYPLRVVGVSKTVDNDLVGTDHCPGYGSAAKYTSVALMEAARDLWSMSADSTQVFILESMGRHAGWLAAASSLAGENSRGIPHIILLPEVRFHEQRFLQKVDETLAREGYCTIVAAEALQRPDGQFVSSAGYSDAFGNVQLGKVGLVLERLIRAELGKKVHTALPDYLQRSARHLASWVDWKESIDVGAFAVHLAADRGETDCMVAIVRDVANPYVSHYEAVPLEQVGGRTRHLPTDYIAEDGFHVSERFRRYVLPLVQGEAPNSYVSNGLPRYAELGRVRAERKLPEFKAD